MRRLAAALLLAAAAGVAAAQPPRPAAGIQTAPPRYKVHAGVRPGHTELGRRVTYRGSVWVERGTRLQWRAPRGDGAFTWGPLRTGRKLGYRGSLSQTPWGDSIWVETTLQVFATGRVAIPGIAFTVDRTMPYGRRLASSLPVVWLDVVPLVSPLDTTAQLRPLRGPLAAPWWECVPWSKVGLAALGLALAAVLVVLWRRRRRTPAVAPAPAAVPRPDPVAEALAALAELRARHLPEHGRFGDHALRLTHILRRFCEGTAGLPRPGDTTPELLDHLRESGLAAEDLARLAALLRTWDGIKFARAPQTVEDALRTETAVEAFVRRPRPGAAEAQGKVA